MYWLCTSLHNFSAYDRDYNCLRKSQPCHSNVSGLLERLILSDHDKPATPRRMLIWSMNKYLVIGLCILILVHWAMLGQGVLRRVTLAVIWYAELLL